MMDCTSNIRANVWAIKKSPVSHKKSPISCKRALHWNVTCEMMDCTSNIRANLWAVKKSPFSWKKETYILWKEPYSKMWRAKWWTARQTSERVSEPSKRALSLTKRALRLVKRGLCLMEKALQVKRSYKVRGGALNIAPRCAKSNRTTHEQQSNRTTHEQQCAVAR